VRFREHSEDGTLFCLDDPKGHRGGQVDQPVLSFPCARSAVLSSARK
jgi:hypothetical protein